MSERPSGSLYKIARDEEWQRALRDGSYDGSPDDLRDGFIHCSLAHQVRETARKYFRGQSGLWLLGVDAARLGSTLRMEPSRGGDLFPHVYGPLPVSAVLWSRPLPAQGPDFVWPAELGDN